jgi:hypothetical protein
MSGSPGSCVAQIRRIPLNVNSLHDGAQSDGVEKHWQLPSAAPRRLQEILKNFSGFVADACTSAL